MVGQKYQHGFVTDIDSDTVPPGLDEDVVRSSRRRRASRPSSLEWRLKALRHWLTMREPHWATRALSRRSTTRRSRYYSAPKRASDAPKSLDEVDPKLLATYEKLGIPLHERARARGRRGRRGVRQRSRSRPRSRQAR